VILNPVSSHENKFNYRHDYLGGLETPPPLLPPPLLRLPDDEDELLEEGLYVRDGVEPLLLWLLPEFSFENTFLND
jgi:hypothetical protein